MTFGKGSTRCTEQIQLLVQKHPQLGKKVRQIDKPARFGVIYNKIREHACCTVVGLSLRFFDIEAFFFFAKTKVP